MRFTHGNIIIYTGIAHCLLGISPFAFGKQFEIFSTHYFFNISQGLFEFPLLNGSMNFENFATFWFVYFGLLLLLTGTLLHHIEKTTQHIPKKFISIYGIIVCIGVYMIPFSGMTFLMLPHAIYMFVQRNNTQQHVK